MVWVLLFSLVGPLASIVKHTDQFSRFVTMPFLARDPKAIEVVQVILESILLRREKTMRDRDGNRIVELPPKDVMYSFVAAMFSSFWLVCFIGGRRRTRIYSSWKEDLWLHLYLGKAKFWAIGRERTRWEELHSHFGHANEVIEYLHLIDALLISVRLRRAVLHPHLVLTKNDERALSPDDGGKVDVNDLIARFAQEGQSTDGGPNKFADNFMASLNGIDNADCPICFNEMEIPMVLPECMHQLYVFHSDFESWGGKLKHLAYLF